METWLMDGWDLALLVVAAFLAVTALVRLMVAHRDKIVADFRAQIEQEHQSQEGAKASAAIVNRDRAA